MNNEVFITGREGFAGTWLTKELGENGYDVSGTTLKEMEDGEKDNIFQCDITDATQIRSIISVSYTHLTLPTILRV